VKADVMVIQTRSATLVTGGEVIATEGIVNRSTSVRRAELNRVSAIITVRTDTRTDSV
jgi:hypothetical protein